MLEVLVVYVIGKPDVAVAFNGVGAATNVRDVGRVKVIDCGVRTGIKVCTLVIGPNMDPPFSDSGPV
jgi:hypothetical protein